VRAARSLGAGSRDVFRTVIVPGALPYVITGLQVAMGVAWFSLVAGEMVAGQSGLGYLINYSYTTTKYPTIVIGMLTLGIVGWGTSAAVRVLGERLLAYRSVGSAA
jgi:NitT/TauT family transport system permease protein